MCQNRIPARSQLKEVEGGMLCGNIKGPGSVDGATQGSGSVRRRGLDCSSWKQYKKKNQGSWGRATCGGMVGSRDFADRVNW